MKRIFFCLSVLCISFKTYSQTNSLPTSGNVGIGITNPEAGLHIVKDTGLFIDDSSVGFPGRIRMTDGSPLGIGGGDAKDDLLFESDGAFLFMLDRNRNGISNIPGFGIFDKDGESIFFARDNGNVGIGTINPSEKLHIGGSIRGNSTGGALRVQTNSGYMDIGSQNSSWAHIYTDRPKIIFNKDIYTTTNAFSSYNNDLVLKTKGTERLRINDETGRVGIGTSSPEEKLHVNGTTSITADIGNVNDDYWKTGNHTLELQNNDAGDVILSFHRAGHSNAIIKHTEAGGLIFCGNETHNQNHMTITSNGNVGIGATPFDGIKTSVQNDLTSIPTYGSAALFAYGSSSHTSGLASKVRGVWALSLNNKSGTLSESMGIDVGAGNESSGTGTVTNAYGVNIDVQKGRGIVTNGYGVFIKRVQGDNTYGIYQQGDVTKNYFAGNVGIGVKNPTANLDISGGTGDSELLIEADSDNSDEMDNPFITFSQDQKRVFGFIGLVGNADTAPHVDKYQRYVNESGTWVQRADYPGTLPNYLFLGMNNSEGVQLGSQGNVRLTVHHNGSVGIGTSTPPEEYKLAIAGKMISEEVKVQLQTAWPDYVFNKNYNLPTLQQVENHISEKGHLINIPSAAEVAENGIMLGEMNAKLLEKIEELTLYTIAQEKKIRNQEHRNTKLETKNAELEARLARIEKLLTNKQ